MKTSEQNRVIVWPFFEEAIFNLRCSANFTRIALVSIGFSLVEMGADDAGAELFHRHASLEGRNAYAVMEILGESDITLITKPLRIGLYIGLFGC